MALIEVNSLSKDFRNRVRYKSALRSLVSFIRPQYKAVKALEEVSFSIEPGELVGYIGPNGAGKSTTIKLLSGILTPSTGQVLVRGREPYLHRKENALNMGVVFGQRSQLYWDLPLSDSLDVFKVMYRIGEEDFIERLAFLREILGLDEFMDRPVRTLSLGQKMRANLTAAFIHNPDIVYLDEPTIGLDVMAKEAIRKFIRRINKTYGTTVVLTTHDMDDIEEICDRLILIDKGKLFFDGPLADFKTRYALGSEIILETLTPLDKLEQQDRDKAELVSPGRIRISGVEREQVPQIVQDFLTRYPVKEISVENASLEEIIKGIFRS